MTIRNIISTVLSGYAHEKERTFKENSLAKLLRAGFKGNVENDVLGDNIVTSGSPGQGQWATVPWIGIFDKEISTSATRGFYIVYLFSSDMKSVYVSLNQGWTFFQNSYGKNAAKRVENVAQYFQSTLVSKTDRMTTEPIHLLQLTERNKLVTGYELGNIFSIKYEADNLPTNKQMENDLTDMLVCLKAIKKCLVNSHNIAESVEYILSIDEKSDSFFSDSTKKIAQNLPVAQLVETFAPSTSKEKPAESSNVSKKGRKVKYAEVQKNNSEVGFFGEKAVLNFEKEKLREYPDLAEKVEHVSVKQGDGLGYDILSFDEEGNKVFIEVKTTTQGKDAPFYISNNEVDVALKHPNSYVLYRIYDVQNILENKNKIEFFKVKGDRFQSIKLSPVNYRASI
ncbi:MrcB family domain-containing protein [Fructobacillus tropaeoli]|uniref:MrcB family domain-containing protein n=1 Tax=Fructobacillus tropaeoli TaxID=709323 RepID=UPI002D91CC3F|nr:Predicted restriction endonuclease [Fructobacillus tropaeoli]